MKTAAELREISKQNADKDFERDMRQLSIVLERVASQGKTFFRAPREIMKPRIQEKLILLGYEVQFAAEAALVSWDS